MKILVIRFSSIGDNVLITPVLRCLNEQIVDAEIHVLVKPAFAMVHLNNPHVSKVWLWEKGVMQRLKEEHFDHIVDLHHNLRSLRVKLALRRPSTSFPKLNLEKLLLVRFGINHLPQKHVVDRYFEAVRCLGVRNDDKGIEFYPSSDDKAVLQKLPTTFLNGYTAIVCGALKGTKCITDDKLIQFCKGINGPLLFIGGANESALGERLVGFIGSRAISMCGKSSIGESAVLLQHARAVLTPDTGMMHIAAAFNKPIAVIWGNTVRDFGMGPYMPQNNSAIFHLEVENLSCRPCSKIGFDVCPKKHFNCMHLQKVEPVCKWLNSHSSD